MSETSDRIGSLTPDQEELILSQAPPEGCVVGENHVHNACRFLRRECGIKVSRDSVRRLLKKGNGNGSGGDGVQAFVRPHRALRCVH